MTFADRIVRARPRRGDAQTKAWIYVPYDQLTDEVGPMVAADPDDMGIVFVESCIKPNRRPYHKKKLALLLANQRHFALEQAERGFQVLYLTGEATFGTLLARAQRSIGLGPIQCMRPAERELRVDLADAVEHEGLHLATVSNDTWLTSPEDFEAACGTSPGYRMDRFYRHVRKKTGWLMRDGKPEGGRFSFDAENRKAWPGEPKPHPPLRFEPDAITREVMDLVQARFPTTFGTLDGFAMPASRRDASCAWAHARRHALPLFGPFEDAISDDEPLLFHTGLSALINLSRILPRDIVRDVLADVEAGVVPVASGEGFVRQVAGWREFMRHVHEATDGFHSIDTSGAPNALGAHEQLPPVFWGETPSGLRCLDRVVEPVWRDGYSHHITRLMVLSNIATLLGVSPRALTDWFWVAYNDAYDWVVEPNVLGMGTFADGGVMTTKPYVSGAGYIDRMSDLCKGCQFDPKGKSKTSPCPLTPMYWDFLTRNRTVLEKLQRMKLPLASAAKRSKARRDHDRYVADRVRRALGEGLALEADVAALPAGW